MFDQLFKLKKPCANCPFRKVGAIELAPGRVEGIVAELMADDYKTFYCHKTLSGDYEEPDDTEGEDSDDVYIPGSRDAACAGAIIYLEKIGRPSVGMRFGHMTGDYVPERYADSVADVIDPLDVREAMKAAVLKTRIERERKGKK